jgi:APA family basic amino acid/polyamine antiporter
LIGLGIAALVAYCNATSSAELAAVHPESGGAYVYGRKRLGPFWGFLAGWGFVIGKLASCAAMAMTFGAYAAPSLARPLAIGAVVVLTAVNYRGVKKTALLTRGIVAIVVGALAVVVAAVWLGGSVDATRAWPPTQASVPGVLRAAGFLFFAFAGYARVATLGEEVAEPKRVIPRAIPIALGITLAIYVTVAVTALVGVGAEALATSTAPLATAVESTELAKLVPVVRMGATVASLGVLLSLIVGVSRTLFAMSSNGDMPSFLAAVHPRYQVPHRAELVVGAVVAVAVTIADVRAAIGFSSFAVLVYYSIANAAAFRLAPDERRFPRWLSVVGLLGCVILACALPVASILGGAIVLGAGIVAYVVSRPARAK